MVDRLFAILRLFKNTGLLVCVVFIVYHYFEYNGVFSMDYLELSKLRAKRGKAQERAYWLSQFQIVDGAVQHATLYAVDLGWQDDEDRENRSNEVSRLEMERDTIIDKLRAVCLP